jgi:hypothetical protein
MRFSRATIRITGILADPNPVAILEAWVNAHPRYAFTVESSERRPSGGDEVTVLRITIDSVQNTESIHVLAGRGRGTDLTWSGGERIVVRGPGLAHMLAVQMNVRHERILTLTDDRGIACGPEYADGTIMTDRITVDAADGRPLLRERLEGPNVVGLAG